VAKFINKIHIYCDGGCKPNPGEMCISYLILDDKENELKKETGLRGNGTNIIAELQAIEFGLENALSFTRNEVHVYSDCEIAVRKIDKTMRSHKKDHIKYLESISSKSNLFGEVKIHKVSERNKYIRICDRANSEKYNKHGI